MNLTRRDFLKLAALTGAALTTADRLPLFADVADVAEEGSTEPLRDIAVGGLIRPPGALPEKLFRAKCVSCGVCMNVCHAMKYDAITTAGFKNPRFPLQGFAQREPGPFSKGGNTPLTPLNRGESSPPLEKGDVGGFFNYNTPYIKDMRDFPCGLCMECPKHCPTGALQPVEKEDVRMGMALIDFGLCFGWNGDVCLSCSKACPLGATVFEFYNGEWGNQPYINDNCVGCGLCVKYCPMRGSAIKVVTKKQYENVKSSYVNDFNKLMVMSNEERYNIVYSNNLPNIMARGRIVEREYR
ncbi:MAG: 4Fe-4S binding protein [Nitrospirae bacterium]|nr:4Fe-4S binding protein [Nitrospirota bacterium]